MLDPVPDKKYDCKMSFLKTEKMYQTITEPEGVEENRKLSIGSITIILIIGFLLRLLWWAYAEPVPISDYEEYRILAHGLLYNGSFGIQNPSAWRLPGYPFFLASMMLISNSIAWLSLTNVVLSTALIYIVYKTALQLTSEKFLSICAALICALNPTFVFLSPVLASEHMFSLLLFSAFLLVTKKRNSNKVMLRFFFSGLMFGAAMLTRGEGIFFLPIYLLMAFWSSNRMPIKIVTIIILIFSVGIAVTPWYIRNHLSVGPGSSLSTSGGINFYFAHNDVHYGWRSLEGTIFDGKDEIEQQKLGYQLGMDYLSSVGFTAIMKDILKATKRLFLKSGEYSVEYSIRLQRSVNKPSYPYPIKNLPGTKVFFTLTKAYFGLFFCAVFSCLFLLRYSIEVWTFLYGTVLVNWIGYSWIFWSKARYRYTSEIIFCILAALVISEISKRLPIKKDDLFKTIITFI